MKNKFLNLMSLHYDKQKKSFIIIILFLLLLLYCRLKKNKTFIKLLKEIKNEDDVKLYLKNKTEFYFKYRLKMLKRNKKVYNESHLITFQDKLNYLVIHENPEFKTDIVDKIKIHQYSKKILGKDICVPILKVYENKENKRDLVIQTTLPLDFEEHKSEIEEIVTWIILAGLFFYYTIKILFADEEEDEENESGSY
jgi:hypothetical protein